MFRLVLLLVVVVVDEEGVWKVVMPPRPQWFCVRSRNGDDKNDGDVKADPRAASEAIKTTRQSMEILIGWYEVRWERGDEYSSNKVRRSLK